MRFFEFVLWSEPFTAQGFKGLDALCGKSRVVNDDVHRELTPDIGVAVRRVGFKDEGGSAVFVGLCTTVRKLRLVGVVKVHDDINARQSSLRVFCNDGERTANFLLFIFNDVEQVNRDDGVDLYKDGLTDACSVQIERVVSSDVQEEVLRSDLKPVRGRGFQREIPVGPGDRARGETASTLTTALAIRTVTNREEEILEDLTGTTDFLNRTGVEDGFKHAVRTGHHRRASGRVDLNEQIRPHPNAVFSFGRQVGLCPFEDHGDGVLSTRQIHGCRNGSTPGPVCSGGGGKQGGAVELDEKFEAYQAVSVNRVKVVQASTEIPGIAPRGVNAVLKEEGDPRAMAEEEGDVAFTASVVALRSDLCHEGSVSEVEDIGDHPFVGEIAVGVGWQRVDDNAFNDQLDLMVGNTRQLVIDHGPGNHDRFVDRNR